MLEKELGTKAEAMELKQIWKEEEARIEYRNRNITQHKRSPVLVGIWQNKTVLDFRNWLMKKKD